MTSIKAFIGTLPPSPKSRGVTLALCAVLGVFGAHRFYVGKIGTGILQLCTIGGLGIWWLYDLIVVAAGGFRDADYRRVVNWSEADERSPHLPADLASRLQLLADEVQASRSELTDLAERVDFLERVLMQVRERESLRPPF